MTNDHSNEFTILSLDGGGIRGIYSAAFLAYLEDDLGIEIADHFDLIAGTSTGGIIAIGLGLGLRPRDILEFYCSYGPKIFYGNRLLRGLLWLVRRKYSNKPLARALQETFGERTLADSRKRLVIPSYNLSSETVRLFKTPHHARLRRDWRIPAWKVALATASAPTFFPAFNQIDEQRLIDGGVWANNPVIFAVVEAVGVLEKAIASLRVLSIGTTSASTRRPDRLDQGGLFAWRNHAIDVMMSGQAMSATNSAKLLIGSSKLSRVNVTVPKNHFSLDSFASEKLIAEAAQSSQQFSDEFAQVFLAHRAESYTPLYSEES